MRAHSTTTITRSRRSASHRVLALVLATCSLAVPAVASADPAAPYASPDAIVRPPSVESSSQPDSGGSLGTVSGLTPDAIVRPPPSDSSLSGEAAAVAAGHAHRTPGELAQRTAPIEPGGSGGSPDLGSAFAGTPDAIVRPHTSEPALVSGPTTADDGFDWGSAAVGAGAAMALACLGGAVLLTVRRRTAVSPSAASMS